MFYYTSPIAKGRMTILTVFKVLCVKELISDIPIKVISDIPIKVISDIPIKVISDIPIKVINNIEPIATKSF